MLIESTQSPFIYVTCQVGAEPALKAEIARVHPELKFAFSRPGFVTFKSSKDLGPDFALKSVFARSFGLSHGRLDEKHAPRAEWAAVVVKLAKVVGEGKPVALHVWSRDRFLPGDAPLGEEPDLDWKKARAIETEIREHVAADAKALFDKKAPIALDVVRVEDGEWWLGSHVVDGPGHSPWVGGLSRIDLPAQAPSRAYLKLQEAIEWSGAPLQKGDTAVEIGSAPGGAVYALLQRGLNVLGIDPGEMAPELAAYWPENFKHIARPISQVGREEMPDDVHWLLVDMNVEPRVSVVAADRIATRMMDSLLGVLLTVKLNQWKMAEEIPEILERVRSIGMSRVRAAQLSNHRQEILVFGLTRKGMARLGKQA